MTYNYRNKSCAVMAIAVLLLTSAFVIGLSPASSRRSSIHPVAQQNRIATTSIISSPFALSSKSSDEESQQKTSTTSLYDDLPAKKPWTFGILTSGFPPQQLLVPFVKFVTFQVWRLMMNELVTHDEQGRFIRESFQAGNNPAPLDLDGSYRLYLGNPCPWCHRVKAAVAVLGVENQDIPITMLIDDAEKASKGGWILPKPSEEDKTSIAEELITGDLAGVYNFCYRDILGERERYHGRCTAPLLVDVNAGKIVTNESNEIMVLLNDYSRRKGSFADTTTIDLRPVGMEEELDKATKYWFNLLWNGAYRCGFATSQVAYDEAASDVLKGLSEMNDLLASRPYLMGDAITEVDLKNFAWVTRHDYAYTIIFKSPGGRIAQYRNIAAWVKRMVSDYPKLLESLDMSDACGSYYRQLFMLNFGRIVPNIPSAREWVSAL
eukprot:CAMPEP_0171374620 /NCGR_PEP_ID=MMETSP0879-20121228/15149_1 /TAXON_ID=67004 /ORGANISM="Thalassiosira weissflogii, Strain CCMP1336" /LENGTH=435 /DNA_ID=CAMNT_0011884021 /DNA_START=53 /DNA_END=1360 /DNA_ORIENTATION=+